MNQDCFYGYFAGALFTNKDLTGNSLLAQKIFEISDNTLLPILPQNLEQRELFGASIRSNDLLALARADWAVFHFDGTELDSGTVVEHELAKTLDIPYVILRTDFRLAGDASDLPWNLMNRPAPRGKVLVADCMSLYQKGLNAQKGDSSLGKNKALDLLLASTNACEHMHSEIARLICDNITEVMRYKPVLDPDEFKSAASLQAKTAGESFGSFLHAKIIEEITERRISVNKSMIV